MQELALNTNNFIKDEKKLTCTDDFGINFELFHDL